MNSTTFTAITRKIQRNQKFSKAEKQAITLNTLTKATDIDWSDKAGFTNWYSQAYQYRQKVFSDFLQLPEYVRVGARNGMLGFLVEVLVSCESATTTISKQMRKQLGRKAKEAFATFESEVSANRYASKAAILYPKPATNMREEHARQTFMQNVETAFSGNDVYKRSHPVKWTFEWATQNLITWFMTELAIGAPLRVIVSEFNERFSVISTISEYRKLKEDTLGKIVNSLNASASKHYHHLSRFNQFKVFVVLDSLSQLEMADDIQEISSILKMRVDQREHAEVRKQIAEFEGCGFQQAVRLRCTTIDDIPRFIENKGISDVLKTLKDKLSLSGTDWSYKNAAVSHAIHSISTILHRQSISASDRLEQEKCRILYEALRSSKLGNCQWYSPQW